MQFWLTLKWNSLEWTLLVWTPIFENFIRSCVCLDLGHIAMEQHLISCLFLRYFLALWYIDVNCAYMNKRKRPHSFDTHILKKYQQILFQIIFILGKKWILMHEVLKNGPWVLPPRCGTVFLWKNNHVPLYTAIFNVHISAMNL